MKKPLCLFTMLLFTPLTAQIINVKTYPVLSDENMFSFPSRYQAMGNADISVSDDVKNLFVNPAALVSAKRVAIFFLPRRSSWSYERESNTSTTPDYRSKSLNRMAASNLSTQVSAVSSSGNLALSAVMNYQRLSSNDLEEFTYTGGPLTPNESSFGATNFPAQVGAALNIPQLGMSIGAQYSFLSVNGIDGIQFLYPNSKSINVRGKSSDSRLGVMGDLFGLGSYEALAGIFRFATTQTAYFESQSPLTNKDENKTKYLQLNYRFSLSDRVRVGLKGVVNWKELPQLPNYPIAGIPRDPGTITAYNLGIGMSWTTASSAVLLLEYVFEPLQANTWVVAEADRDLADGRVFPKGAREQENNYTFSNHIMRGGAEFNPEDWLTVRLGAEVHSYKYDYYHKNFVRNTEQTRTPQTLWSEVRLSVGATLSWGNCEISYLIESMQGRGLLEQGFYPWFNFRALANDFLLVPNEWLTVRPIPVLSHQISVAYYLF